MRPARFIRVAVLSLVSVSVSAICEEGSMPLFVCETERPGRFLSICAVEEVPGKRWSAVQYRFGAPDKPELVFPSDDHEKGQLFFSHEARGDDYRVSIRFTRGDTTYRVFSNSGEAEAGVVVTSESGQETSIRCIERPTMFPSYLRMALPCDEEQPHGVDACGEEPYRARQVSDGRSSWR